MRFLSKRRQRQPAPIVLLYHRVAALPSDPQLLAVTPDRFEQQMDVLRRDYNPMSLGELVHRTRVGDIRERTVAVTFDDGYADNLSTAVPILSEHGIPATFFVATGATGGRREFWWDELERLILLAPRLPRKIVVRAGNKVRTWDGIETDVASGQVNPHCGWNMESKQTPTGRQRAYLELCRYLRRISPHDREAVLDELRSMSGGATASRPDYRALDADELAVLSDTAGMEVGAHTISHSVLSTLSVTEQREEISGSRTALRRITGKTTDTFAYPFGGATDFSALTVSLVKEAGFSVACANIASAVSPQGDPLRVPRILVRNWQGAEFARHIQFHAATR